MADRKGRIKELILKNLSDIISFQLNTTVTQFTTINELVFSKDNSICKVYVSSIDKDKIDNIVSFLNNRKGKIRSILSSKLDLYKIPELEFYKDDLPNKNAIIDNKIREANENKTKTLKDVYGEDFDIKK